MNDRIAINPKVCHGKPVIRGTRVLVSVIVGGMAAGMTMADIEREYGVSSEDIRAALAYANSLIERDQYHPLPTQSQMGFLLDANLPRSLAGALRTLGHRVVDVRDINLAAADDAIIAKHAKREQLVIVSRDFDFADVRNYPPKEFAGILVIDLPSETSVETIIEIVVEAVRQLDFDGALRGRLVIVEGGRIRIRIETDAL